ncbi:unnamed protein product, partial [Meganyctiphanes norvegica]
VIMPKTTSAERVKLFRRRRAEIDPNFKKNESKRISDIKKKQRASMSEHELSLLREKNRLKTKAWRDKQKSKKKEKVAHVTKHEIQTLYNNSFMDIYTRTWINDGLTLQNLPITMRGSDFTAQNWLHE